MAAFIVFLSVLILPAMIVGKFIMAFTSHFEFSITMGLLLGLPMSAGLVLALWGRPSRRGP